MADIRVDLVELGHGAKGISVDLRLWDEASVLICTNEETNWNCLVDREVNFHGLFDWIDWVPVAV